MFYNTYCYFRDLTVFSASFPLFFKLYLSNQTDSVTIFFQWKYFYDCQFIRKFYAWKDNSAMNYVFILFPLSLDWDFSENLLRLKTDGIFTILRTMSYIVHNII